MRDPKQGKVTPIVISRTIEFIADRLLGCSEGMNKLLTHDKFQMHDEAVDACAANDDCMHPTLRM